jgi:allophanate hydrolase subunit 1
MAEVGTIIAALAVHTAESLTLQAQTAQAQSEMDISAVAGVMAAVSSYSRVAVDTVRQISAAELEVRMTDDVADADDIAAENARAIPADPQTD